MRPTTLLLPAVAAVLLAATGAYAASPALSGSLSTAPLPVETNPGAISGSPQSLQPIPNGDLGTGPSFAPPEQATGTAGSSIFSPNASGSSASGSSTSGMSVGG